MTPRTPPPFEALPPAIRDALDALREDATDDPALDAVHVRMRPRFQEMVARKLGLDARDEDDEQSEEKTG